MVEQSFEPYVVALAYVAVLLLVGMILRAKIPVFQRFLIPASLIGGVLGFVLISSLDIGVTNKTFELMAYHLFNLSFISLALISPDTSNKTNSRFLKRALWMTFVWTIILGSQSLIGVGIMSLWQMITGNDFFLGLGFMSGYGFAQGPGPNLAIGTTWQEQFDIQFAISIGLAFAAIGYFVSLIAGIPLVNKGVRENLGTYPPAKLSLSFKKGIPIVEERESAGTQTTYPSNIDTLAFHLALIIAVYGFSYYVITLIHPLLPPTIAKMAYGYLFIFGLFFAVLTKNILKALKVDYLLNPPLQRRISGTMVDFLIVPTMMAIEFAAVQAFAIPLVVISVLCVFATIGILRYFINRSKFPYPYERLVTIFGGAMGTIANALILLKILDPDFKTSVAMEVVYYNLLALLTMTHLVLIIGGIPGGMGVLGMVGVFIGTMAVMLVLLRVINWEKE